MREFAVGFNRGCVVGGIALFIAALIDGHDFVAILALVCIVLGKINLERLDK